MLWSIWLIKIIGILSSLNHPSFWGNLGNFRLGKNSAPHSRVYQRGHPTLRPSLVHIWSSEISVSVGVPSPRGARFYNSRQIPEFARAIPHSVSGLWTLWYHSSSLSSLSSLCTSWLHDLITLRSIAGVCVSGYHRVSSSPRARVESMSFWVVAVLDLTHVRDHLRSRLVVVKALEALIPRGPIFFSLWGIRFWVGVGTSESSELSKQSSWVYCKPLSVNRPWWGWAPLWYLLRK